MFLDCLIDGDIMPVCNGTPDAVKAYILKHQPFSEDYRVYVGAPNKIVTIDEYLAEPET